MHNKLHKVTGVPLSSAEAEHRMLNEHIHEALKPVHRSGSQRRATNTSMRPDRYLPRERSPRMIVVRVVFTAEEHLEAQQLIERRAREFQSVRRVPDCRRSSG